MEALHRLLRSILCVICISTCILYAGTATAEPVYKGHINTPAGRSDFISFLIKHKADLNKEKGGFTPLRMAIYDRNPDLIKTLAEHGADVNQSDKRGETPLLITVKAGDIKASQLLINNGADVNLAGKNGITPLLAAKRADHPDIARLLADNGAGKKSHLPLAIKQEDIETVDAKGNTPLLQAAKANNMDAVYALIERGANIHAVTKNGDNLLFIMAAQGEAEAFISLMKKGLDIHHKNNAGVTALFYAASSCNHDILRIMIAEGLDLNAEDGTRRTPLFYAVGMGSYMDAQRLIAIPDITKAEFAKRLEQKTQYRIACITLLIENGADVHTEAHGRNIIVREAKEQSHPDIVKLIEHYIATTDPR